GHAGHPQQGRPDGPVGHHRLLHQVHRLRRQADLHDPAGRRQRLDHDRRTGPVGQLGRRLGHPLRHPLPGLEGVGAGLEDQLDRRQLRHRLRPDDVEARDAVEGLLERHGDERLDLRRRQALRGGLHLHLRRGELGEDVDGVVLELHRAEHHHPDRRPEDEEAELEAGGDDPAHHWTPTSSPSPLVDTGRASPLTVTGWISGIVISRTSHRSRRSSSSIWAWPAPKRRYRAGRRNSTSTVEVTSPPMITPPMGLMISWPGRSPRKANGAKNAAVAAAVSSVGPNRSRAPAPTRPGPNSMPSSRSSVWKRRRRITPLRTAMPNTVRNPTSEPSSIVPPSMRTARALPTSASGSVTNSSAASRHRPKTAWSSRNKAMAATRPESTMRWATRWWWV